MFILYYILPILALVLSGGIGALLMPTIVRFANKHNMVARPNKRTSHIGSIPNIGGVNIVLSMSPILIAQLAFGAMSLPVFVGIYLIFVIGFIDDRLVLSAYWKLIGETLCAFCLIYFADVRIVSMYGIFGIAELPLWASYALSYFCYVVIINALNLMDGVDGLASGLGMLYCIVFGLWFWAVGMLPEAIGCFGMVGALAVFFVFNVFSKKRKIFMGDAGSLVLGYIFAFYIFSFLQRNAQIDNSHELGSMLFANAPATVLGIVFVPIFDLFRVSLTRLKKGKSIFEADRNHIHHLLLSIGLKHRQVTFVLLSVSIFYVILAYFFRNINIMVQVSIFLLIAVLLILILWWIINAKKANEHSETILKE